MNDRQWDEIVEGSALGIEMACLPLAVFAAFAGDLEVLRWMLTWFVLHELRKKRARHG